MFASASQFAHWLLLVWICVALWVSPTRMVHAHERGECQHSRFEHHEHARPHGDGLPGRHAHFVIFGREVHIPLPEHEVPSGLATDENLLAPQSEKHLQANESALFVDTTLIFEDLPWTLTQALIRPGSRLDCESRPPAPSGRSCRVLMSSLTI